MTKAVGPKDQWTKSLPSVHLTHALQYLDAGHAARCQEVCKAWRGNIQNNETQLWRPLCAEHYPEDFRDNNNSDTPRSYKEVAKTQWLAERRIPNRYFRLCHDPRFEVDLSREFRICRDRICTPSAEVAYSFHSDKKKMGLVPFKSDGTWLAHIPKSSYVFQGKNFYSPANQRHGRVNLVHFYSGQSKPLFTLDTPIDVLVSSSTHLFVATADNKVHIYEFSTEPLTRWEEMPIKEIATLPLPSSITRMEIHKKKLIAGGADGTVRVFSLPEYTLVREFRCGTESISCLLARGGKLYAGTNAPQNEIAVYDLASGQLKTKYSWKEENKSENGPPPFDPESLCMHNHILWCGGSDGTILKIDTKSGQQTRIVPPLFANGNRYPITCIRYASGKIFYGDGKIVSSFNLTTQKEEDCEFQSPIHIVSRAKSHRDLEWLYSVLRSNRDTRYLMLKMHKSDQERILEQLALYLKLDRPAQFKDFDTCSLTARLAAVQRVIDQRKRLLDEAQLIEPRPTTKQLAPPTTTSRVHSKPTSTNKLFDFFASMWKACTGDE